MKIIDEINALPEEELKPLVASSHASFMRHVADMCIRGGIPEYSKPTVERNLAIQHGMVKYKGIYTKLVGVIPDRVKQFIDKETTIEVKKGKKKSIKK